MAQALKPGQKTDVDPRNTLKREGVVSSEDRRRARPGLTV